MSIGNNWSLFDRQGWYQQGNMAFKNAATPWGYSQQKNWNASLQVKLTQSLSMIDDNVIFGCMTLKMSWIPPYHLL